MLCFSLILVTHDNHKHGRTIGTDPKWVIKDIVGVLPAMELERLIGVLGLAYQLPYTPDDGTRRESELLYLSMLDNGFSFMTSMMSKSGEFIIIIILPLLMLLILSENRI